MREFRLEFILEKNNHTTCYSQKKHIFATQSLIQKLIKKMKKLIALFAFVATLSIVACSNGGNEQDAEQAKKDSIATADSIAAVEKMRADSIAAAEAAAAAADTTGGDSAAMMEEGHDGSTH